MMKKRILGLVQDKGSRVARIVPGGMIGAGVPACSVDSGDGGVGAEEGFHKCAEVSVGVVVEHLHDERVVCCAGLLCLHGH